MAILASVEPFNPYIRTYGFTITGALIFSANALVFVILIQDRHIRSSYSILVFSLLAHAICGATCLFSGIYRFAFLWDTTTKVNSKTCFYLSSAFMELWASQLVSTSLLANSIDRLIVVCNSIYYFAHQRRIVKTLIWIAFLVPSIICGGSTVAELNKPDRLVDRVCIAQYLFALPALTYMDIIRTGCAFFSIVLMTCVTVIMKQKQNKINKFRARASIEKSYKAPYLNSRQTSYTISTFICNMSTLTLYVIPMTYQFFSEMSGNPWIGTVKLYVLMLTYINQLNIVLTFVPRQKDITVCVKKYFHSKRSKLQSTITAVTTSAGNTVSQR